MNIKQLIYELQQFDPKLMVIRPGYEGGLEEIAYFRQINIDLNVNKGAWYLGPHEENENGTTGAVLLS